MSPTPIPAQRADGFSLSTLPPVQLIQIEPTERTPWGPLVEGLLLVVLLVLHPTVVAEGVDGDRTGASSSQHCGVFRIISKLFDIPHRSSGRLSAATGRSAGNGVAGVTLDPGNFTHRGQHGLI